VFESKEKGIKIATMKWLFKLDMFEFLIIEFNRKRLSRF
jgi:hypothetical protein